MSRLSRRDLMSGTAAVLYIQNSPATRLGHLFPGEPQSLTIKAAAAARPFDGPARTLYNHSTTPAPAGTPVVMLASFGPGELPAGGSVVPVYNGIPLPAGTYQQAPFSTHPDGSLHEGTLTLLTPAAIPASNGGKAAGALTGLVLTTSSNAPAPAAAITLAQIQARLAAADIRVDLTGCDLGATVYRLSCAEVLANFPAYPWGTSYPLGGYRVLETGPFPLIEFWRFLKNTTTGAPHAWVKARLFVRFFSASAGGLALIGNPVLENDNCYGPVSPSADFATGLRPRVIAGSVTVFEGANTIISHGGANDPRAIKTTAGDLVGASNSLRGALLARMAASSGVGWTFSGPGVPAGLSATQTYWPVQTANAVLLATSRQLSQNTQPPAWAVNTGYSAGGVVTASNALWVNTQSGTSATTGAGPSGAPNSVNIADGSTTWQCFSAIFGAAGTGAVLASPAVHVSQRGHQRLGLPNTAPAWIGVGYDVVAGHDLPHLFRVSRSTPAYEPAAVASLVAAVPTYNVFTPGMAPNWGWNLDNTGNGGNDDRIGPINHYGIQALYRPGDTNALQTARAAALQFADYPFNYTDERDGLPVCVNNGPAKNGVAYPNRAAPNPGFQAGNGPGYGAPPLLSEGTLFRDRDAGQYQSNYSRYADFSHQARSWRAAWLISGDAAHLVTAKQQANAAAGLSYLRTQAVKGITYYACYADNSQQRDSAWALAAHGDAVAALPLGDPTRTYLLDMLIDAAAWLNAAYTVGQLGGATAAQWGQMQGSTEAATAVPCWEVFMLMIHVLQEKWRGNAPGFGAFWDGYFRNYMKIFNPKYGGWLSATNAYCISATSGAAQAGGLSFADLQTAWPTIAQMYQGPNTDQALNKSTGSHGVLPAEPSAIKSGGPFLGYDPAAQSDFVCYPMVALAVMQQMATAGDPDGPALLTAMRARFGHPKPFSFVNPGNGTPLNILQFAFQA